MLFILYINYQILAIILFIANIWNKSENIILTIFYKNLLLINWTYRVIIIKNEQKIRIFD